MNFINDPTFNRANYFQHPLQIAKTSQAVGALEFFGEFYSLAKGFGIFEEVLGWL